MDWWAEQTAIKEAIKAAEREAETAHAELVRYQDMLQQAAKEEEQAIRRELARATADYNKRLAEEKRLREFAQRQADLAANMAEMETTITSSFMTEVGRGRSDGGSGAGRLGLRLGMGRIRVLGMCVQARAGRDGDGVGGKHMWAGQSQAHRTMGPRTVRSL